MHEELGDYRYELAAEGHITHPQGPVWLFDSGGPPGLGLRKQADDIRDVA